VLEVHDQSGWRAVCAAPCSVRTFAGMEYRVGGERAVTSRPFVVGPSPYPTVVNADVGSPGARTTGVVLIVLGAVAMTGGAVMVLSNDEKTNGQGDEQGKTIGSVVTLAGGGLLTAGIIMITSNRTRLTFAPATPVAATPRLRLAKGIELAAEGLKF
jgi:hypothetical protein